MPEPAQAVTGHGPPIASRASRRPRRVIALAAAIVALAAVAFVLLGSTSSKLDPVAQAATRSASSPGYRARLSVAMSSPALPGAITMTGSGVVDQRAHAASISMAVSLPNLPQVTQKLGGNTLQFTEILDGSTIYVELPSALAGQLSVLGKRWISVDLAKASGVPGLSNLAGGLGGAGGDPSQFLQYLRAASDSVVADGHASIDGYDTTHYQAQLDFSKVANVLPPSQRGTVQKALSALAQEAQLGTIPVNVWIDRSHLVRRIRMTLNMTIRGQSLNATMTEDLSDYGPQTPPSPPPPDQVQAIG
jgi:hypothetical protein